MAYRPLFRAVAAAFAVFTLLGVAAQPTQAHGPGPDGHAAEARYLGNEGVLVIHGETKVLFDAFYRQGFGQYALVPDNLERALLEGSAPFNGVDALFVSHFHGDHFTPRPVLAFLRSQPEVPLFAPLQAVDLLREAVAADDPVLDRVNAVALTPGDPPFQTTLGALLIEAVAIPHSGGARRASVQNLAWRVTLDGDATAAHFGDADPADIHFAPYQAYWDARVTHVAFPPYWFFGTENGRAILSDRIKARQAIGVHVPHRAARDPDAWSHRLDADLFTSPGDIRVIALE
ncbi:MAG: MBL fold metallo-hydrolase [Alphaproteobacteria bacterium]